MDATGRSESEEGPLGDERSDPDVHRPELEEIRRRSSGHGAFSTTYRIWVVGPIGALLLVLGLAYVAREAGRAAVLIGLAAGCLLIAWTGWKKQRRLDRLLGPRTGT